MKKILCLLIFVFLVLPVNAVTLEGSVTYTVEQAREEAFKDIEWTIPKSLIRKHKKDPNHRINIMGREYPKVRLSYRWVTYFSDGTYGVTYDTDLYRTFFYKENGELKSIQVFHTFDYPFKSYRYGLDSKVERIFLHKSDGDIYVFNPNGTLYGHWVGKKAYDLEGNVVLRRLN